MRKLGLLIYLIFLLQVSLISQCDPTFKMVDPDNVWYFSSGGFAEPPYYFRIGFNKEPLDLNGKIYYEKLISYKFGIADWQSTKEFYSEENGTITIYDQWGNQNITYNYCNEIGDTILEKNNFDTLKVIDKKIVEFPNGDLRFKIIVRCLKDDVDDHYGETFFLEGIGSERNGIINKFLNCAFYDGFENLLCFEYKGEKIFSNFGKCWWGSNSIVNNRNIWHVDIQSNSNARSTFQYKFHWADIEKNGKLYKELYEATESEPYPPFKSTGRLFREENNRFYEYISDENERLYYDFNLNKGDSILILDQNYNSELFTVSNVETVIFNDEIERKKLSLSCNTNSVDTLIWIEGIGDIGSFIFSGYNCQSVDTTSQLRCFNNEFQNVYLADWADGCLSTSVDYTKEFHDFKIYPNPSIDKIHFVKEKLIPGIVFIYDMNGRQMMQFKISNKIDEIDISNFKSGMYFLKFQELNTSKIFCANFVKI